MSGAEFTLFDACLQFENLHHDAEQLGQLLFLLGNGSDLDAHVRGAFRACSDLADLQAAQALKLSERALGAHTANKAAGEIVT